MNEETTDEEMEIVFVNEIEDDLIQDLDYKCRSCGESFSEEEAMKKHINIFHKDKKVHKCTSCGKSFSHPGYLKKHGLKCYKCESCGKQAYTRWPKFSVQLPLSLLPKNSSAPPLSLLN